MKTREEYIKKEADKYMKTEQYKKEHDAQSAEEVKERMKELFTEKQLKMIDKLAEEVFGKPRNTKFPTKE